MHQEVWGARPTGALSPFLWGPSIIPFIPLEQCFSKVFLEALSLSQVVPWLWRRLHKAACTKSERVLKSWVYPQS